MTAVKLLLTWLNSPRFLPHLLLFIFRFEDLKYDVKVFFKNTPLQPVGFLSLLHSFVYLMTFNKYYRNLFYYRVGKWKYFISFLAPPHPCFTVGTDTIIGKGCHFEHPFSTIINAESIGDNFEIRNNVTIGVKIPNGRRPVIKNNVIINANSVIIGDILIGNNVIIGAGSVVTKSIPDNCVVVGNPAYILKQDGRRVDKEI